MEDLTYQAEEDARVLGRKLGLSRRQLLAATTGMAAASLLGIGHSHARASTGSAAATSGTAANGVLVPPGKRGIILYTVRDAISRNPLTTDPSLPSGFKAVLEELARQGYKQIEFAGYNQHVNAEGGNVNNVAGAHLLRTWLDDNGLEAEGNHGSIPGTINPTTLAQFDAACEIANILGFGHIGTGSDPTNSAYLADWQAAAERWNILGERAATHGLKLYTHNHDAAYSFLLDSGPLDEAGRPTRSTGVRRLEWFLQNTDPNYVYLEMDVYWAHVAQHRFQSFTAPDGTVVQDVFDPAGLVAEQTIRFPLFHAKDGAARPDLAAGYSIVPLGQGDIDYKTFFQRIGAKGYHNAMYEQDNAATVPTASPSMSLENAATSYQHLASLRG
ncbi:sugar phosphate isomerase/epimerase [Isoptericola variabilis]|uniref:Xylose isomerase domain-containing protein TIM barrel n=1 Tax=Isoptericola variabilis (strain 225) TaxID=743718 RepID=F6FTV6_ISOV2|nr:TIM barrel protein [Isoptericola variabilis]AEG45327.1 Xylose isomerase domain-containing protein TIM barrel [Isoptericola variabilis 225]TWH34830.1 sugar phosphate isomerase/epimerase [Isoptericola variabilis J7]